MGVRVRVLGLGLGLKLAFDLRLELGLELWHCWYNLVRVRVGFRDRVIIWLRLCFRVIFRIMFSGYG